MTEVGQSVPPPYKRFWIRHCKPKPQINTGKTEHVLTIKKFPYPVFEFHIFWNQVTK